MKTVLKLIIALLLLFNGTGAIYGGWNLIAYPDGSSLHMAQSYLQYSPFSTYLIPGIVLFIVNGIGSFAVLFTMIGNVKRYPLFVIAQGVVLTGWIVVQMLMVRMVFYLHVVLGVVGILLILGGWQLHKINKR